DIGGEYDCSSSRSTRCGERNGKHDLQWQRCERKGARRKRDSCAFSGTVKGGSLQGAEAEGVVEALISTVSVVLIVVDSTVVVFSISASMSVSLLATVALLVLIS